MTTGCRAPEMQRCVDENNTVVDDSFCKNQPGQPQQRSDGHGGFVSFFPYRYYYGGWGGYGLGTRVGGGAFTPAAGHSYTARGGFGSSFAEGGSHSSGSSGSGHAGGAGE
jgi:hypothetical protein